MLKQGAAVIVASAELPDDRPAYSILDVIEILLSSTAATGMQPRVLLSQREAETEDSPEPSKVDDLMKERAITASIFAAAERGDLHLLDAETHIPIRSSRTAPADLYALVMRDELQRFAREHLRVDLRVPKRGKRSKPTESDEAQAPTEDSQAEVRPIASDWRELARAYAAEIIARDRGRDLYPSQDQVAEEVARRLREEGIFGPSGKPLAGTTIKRNALKGIVAGNPARRAARGNQGK